MWQWNFLMGYLCNVYAYFDPLDSGEQWIENWNYRCTDASLACSKLYRSRGPKWHNDRDVTSFIYRRLPTKLVPQHSWFYVKHPIIQGLNLMRCAWHLTPCSIHFKKSPVWSYHPCPTHLVPMKNVLGSQKRYVNYPMPVVWKRVSHKSHLSSGRKTEKAPLERQVTFDPARTVPWGSPAGSRKPTKEPAGKHVPIEAKNFTKHQKFQPFNMSYDEKEWHASIPSDKTDHNKTWILPVVFHWIKWSPSENQHVMKIMQSFQLFYPHPKLKCKNGSEYVQFKEKKQCGARFKPGMPLLKWLLRSGIRAQIHEHSTNPTQHSRSSFSRSGW